MKLKDLLRIARNNLILIIIAAVFGGLAGLGAHLLAPASYSARTDVFVSVKASGDLTQMQAASTFVQERMQTYVNMVDSRSVLEPVIQEQKLSTTPEQLASSLQASSETGTVLISIEASAGTAQAAATLSNEVAKSLVSVIEELENPNGAKGTELSLTIADPAVPPASADGLNWWMSTILGIVLGLALGFGTALLRASVDTKIRTKEDVENLTQLPTLASIPTNAELRDKHLDPRRSPFSIGNDAFRRLRTNLQFAQIDDRNQALLVTSAQPGEGKTTTSINLAISLAQSGQKVALVDVDLRSPSVADRLGLENSAGLTTALVGAADLPDLLQPWGQDELYVLTAGETPPNPTEILDSRAMSSILSRLLDEFDSVILDAPPTLPVADSLVIGKQVGRILVVVGLGELQAKNLSETLGSLGVIGVPLSLVLNKVPSSRSQSSGYYRPYAEHAQPTVPFEAVKPETAFEREEHPTGSSVSVDTQPHRTVFSDAFGTSVVPPSSSQQDCDVRASSPDGTTALLPMQVSSQFSLDANKNSFRAGRSDSPVRTERTMGKFDRLTRRQSLAKDRKRT